MFRTSGKWDAGSWAEMARKIYEPGTRACRVVGMTFHHRFHVDLKYLSREDEFPRYYTFILNHINDVLRFINNSRYIEVRISIQSAFSQSEDYVISRVVEIAEVTDENKNCYTVCKCQNGRFYASQSQVNETTRLQYTGRVWTFPPISNTEGKS